jgi:DNA-binding LytR/AlgR family response regulator
MLKCIIVDDEQFSIDSLLNYIDLTEKIDVIQIYLDPTEALNNAVKFDNIDILFLDVNMPNLTGIELAKIFRPKVKKIIFTTCHSSYAFEAFEVEADAFLLKPYTYAKFLTTIHRLFTFERKNDSQQEVSEKDYFLVKNKDENLKVVFIAFKDVIYFESCHNHVRIHLNDQRMITAYLTIKDILQLLNNREDFVQFHRAYILSVCQIKYINHDMITLTNDLTFPVGDKYKQEFRQFLSDNLLKTGRNK